LRTLAQPTPYARCVLFADGPNWLGSPQHLVVGVVAAVVVYVGARRWLSLPWWLALALAVSLVSTAELVLELVEYPLLYSGHFHRSAYYDTLADMANSFVGAVAGAVIAAAVGSRFLRRS
jgi:hypothetical protein